MREPHLTLGEGLMYAYFFLAIIGSIFCFITAVNLIVYIKKRKFYGWLMLLIILPPAIMIIISSL